MSGRSPDHCNYSTVRFALWRQASRTCTESLALVWNTFCLPSLYWQKHPQKPRNLSLFCQFRTYNIFQGNYSPSFSSIPYKPLRLKSPQPRRRYLPLKHMNSKTMKYLRLQMQWSMHLLN